MTDALLDALGQILGDGGLLSSDEAAERAAGVWSPQPLQALALARPRTTQEVASVVRLCHEHRVSVVTHGGLTGLVHGADSSAEQLVLSLERMRAIEHIDPVQRTATVQAGVTLQALQEALEDHGLAFPLDLGARGTATLGGNAATNAGGNRVIRYGMMRDMVLGLEVVLADGSVVSSMNTLIKNNSGYDLKHLFIGSEGTLGVITRLVLRLREAPASSSMALVATQDFAGVAALLKHMDHALGGGLSAFEVMWRDFYRLVTTAPAQNSPPLEQDYPYYVLIEALGADAEQDGERFQAALEGAFEQDYIADAVLALSSTECQKLWALRDDVEQTFRHGVPVVFDVSLPIACMEDYITGIREKLAAQLPDSYLWVFGHLGDGNLHVLVQTAAGDAPAHRAAIETIVYTPLAAIGGAISAEHGIGLEKKPYLHLSRSAEEIALMQCVKQALDPANLLNPGKVL
jgi:FAD/FMN-containing dehydrogenase